MATHKALGRGLDALFSANKTTTKSEVQAAVTAVAEIEKAGLDVRELSVNKIKPNRHQPRSHFDPEALQELSDSIKLHGVAQPLVVTETTAGDYELVMGERRWRASKMAGLETVPCVVKKLSNRERFELALIENLQRQDLNAMEEAIAIDGLMKEYDLTQEQVAVALGKSRSAVANMLRFLRLHESVQASLRDGQITEGHAKVLAGLAEHSEQLRLLEKIIDEQWSVRQLEAMLKDGDAAPAQPKKAKQRFMTPEIKEYEEDFQRELGRRVEIVTSGKKGWIRFAFYSPWDLDNLCKKLGLLKDTGESSEIQSDGG